MRQLYLSAKEASIIRSVTPEHICRECAAGKYSGAKKIDGKWRIPRTADKRFLVIQTKSDLEGLQELETILVSKREEALRRLGTIRECEKFAAAQKQIGGNRTKALVVFASKQDLKFTTLKRWIHRYRTEGIMGLVDGRGGNQYQSPISNEAWEYFKSIYLDENQLSVKLSWQITSYLNDLERRGWKVPSLPTMRNLVDREIPLPVQVLHREGLSAYTAKCESYIEIDIDSVQPGQVWIGDHSQLNCWIRHRSRWIRPWLTCWMDMRSRCVVGWYISASPNQDTILLAAKRAMTEYGLPESAKVDNGRDYDSEMWTGKTKVQRKTLQRGYLDVNMLGGIYGLLDIAVSFAIPYNARAKSIERFFDTLDCQFIKAVPAYCGKDAKRKPTDLNLNDPKTIDEAYDLAAFAALIEEYIEKVYNQSPHSGRGMNGQTPLAVMESREVKRLANEDSLRLLLRSWSKELVVGKNGVKFKGMRYGQYDYDLHLYQGKTVRLAVDPDDLSSVDVHRADSMTFLARVKQNRLVAYGGKVSSEDLREGMKQGRHAKKLVRQWRDKSLAANMDLPDLAIHASRYVNEKNRPKPGPKPKTPHIRPVPTVMDNQIKNHKQLKKAAGAEHDDSELEFDFSLLREPQPPPSPPLDFNFNELPGRKNRDG